jgi:cell division protein FtsQ
MARSLAAPIARRGSARPPFGIRRSLGSAAGAIGVGMGFVRERRRLRLALIAALVALPLLGGGWLLLRDSPVVAVEHVQVSGVQGVSSAAIETALQSAARHMSTLDVNVGALRAAVSRFPVVRDLSVSTSFPHGLHIRVIEQPPVAVLTVGGTHTAVAADGVVLGPELLADLPAPLPAIALGGHASSLGGASSLSGTTSPFRGHVEDATVRGELRVLGAAPHVLLGWVARVFTGGEGLTVVMRNGVSIYFGDAARPHAKWLAAARVLADPSSAGATYVDVRVPERPAAGSTAAGGLEGGATPAQVSASDPTSAALAGVLAEAVSGGLGAASASATPAAAPPLSASGSSAGATPAQESAASSAESSATKPTTTEPNAVAPASVAPATSSPEEVSPSTSG